MIKAAGPVLLLAGAVWVFTQDDTRDFQGFGRVDIGGFLADGEKSPWRLDASERFEVGMRLWVRGTVRKDLLTVKDFERMSRGGAAEIPESQRGEALEVEIQRVHPWCDHMPVRGRDERRQYLLLTVRFRNRTAMDLEVRLARSFFSFDAGMEGDLVTGLSVRGKDGRGSGETTVRLGAGEVREIEWRGDNLYDEDRHGQELFVTLVFAAGQDRLLVRRSGLVQRTD